MKTLGLSALLVLSGCSFQLFKDLDDIKEETWMDIQSRPDQISSSEWPVVLAPGGTTSSGAKFVSAGVSPIAFARHAYNERGELDNEGLRLNDGNDPEASIVIATNLSAAPGQNNVAIGFHDGVTATIAKVNSETGESTSSLFFEEVEAEPPSAMAFGPSDTLYVALGNRIVGFTAFNGDSAQFLCHAPMDAAPGQEEQFRALAHVPNDGNGRLVAVTDEGVYSFVLGEGGGCSDGDFNATQGGQSIVVGQFSGNAAFDVVVGSPGAGLATLYEDAALAPLDPILAPEAAVAFGAHLAGGDIDGDGIDELFIADPGATAGGQENAGVVHVYSGVFESPEATLFDANPAADQQFGRTLAVSVFDGTDEILAVGTNTEMFTYFRLPIGADTDVRTK